MSPRVFCADLLPWADAYQPLFVGSGGLRRSN